MPHSRPLGFWETIQKTFFDSYRCSGMILQIMRVEGSIESGIFAQALHLLQRRHPMLRARFGEAEGKDAFIVPEADEPIAPIPLRVLPFVSDEQVRHIATAESRIAFAGEYLWRAILFQAEGHSDIIFNFHHAIADGYSLVQLVQELMTLCGQLADGRQPDWPCLPLLPATEQMLSRDLPPRAGEAGRAAHGGQKNEPEHLAYESWAPLEQRKLCICLREIPVEDAKKLAAKCRSHGITINGAVMAAMLQAHEAASQPAGIQMEIGLSLRRFCVPEPAPENIGCHIMMLQLVARQAGSFWETAKACQEKIRQSIDLRQRQGFLPKACPPAFIRSAVKNNLSQAEQERRFAAGICYSNPGVLPLEPQYGPFRVTQLHFFGCETAGLWKLFFLTQSLHGRIIFDFIYTEPLVSRNTIETLADSLIDILLRQARA